MISRSACRRTGRSQQGHSNRYVADPPRGPELRYAAEVVPAEVGWPRTTIDCTPNSTFPHVGHVARIFVISE